MARIQVRKNDRTVLDVDVKTFLLNYLKISPPFVIEVILPLGIEEVETILVEHEPENSCGERGHPLDK